MNTLEIELERIGFAARRVASQCSGDYLAALDICEAAVRMDRKLIVCGNGGSAAQAEHFAAELVGRYTRNRPPIPAIAIGTSHALASALANDLGFKVALCQEFAAVASPGDVLIGFSTSGQSENMLNVFSWAALEPSFPRIAITGGSGENKLRGAATVTIAVPSLETARIQEFHLMICHALAADLERRLQNVERFRFFSS